jgi:4-amino-4-deoxy-L-arabinose transferase-like glycosyltransferase
VKPTALRGPRRYAVLLACVATALVHLLFLTRKISIDEGGYATVARFAAGSGRYLYGPMWVDRPPMLIALFDLANHLGEYGVRLVATAFAVLLVAALASTAHSLGGRRAAAWTAWTAFALASSAFLEAERMDGELAAAAFVAVSLAAVARAVTRSDGAIATVTAAALGGAFAAGAVLVKQNFVDAFVFTAVLLGAYALTRHQRRRPAAGRLALVAAGFGTGAAVTGAAALAWAGDHGGIRALLFVMFGFRVDAASVVVASPGGPLRRLVVLTGLAVASGMAVLAAVVAAHQLRRLRGVRPVAWAVAATGVVELVASLAGENSWPHYLIGLVPMVSLATGLAARPSMPGRRGVRRVVVLCVAATAVLSPLAAVHAAEAPSAAYTTGRWVARSADPGDTITVLFTHANVLSASGLAPAYPYAWSLPIRTLDPRLHLLARTLRGPAAPTWVVQWDRPRAWHLDAAGRVHQALHTHYHRLGRVCGRVVWLRADLTRRLTPLPAPSACWGPATTSRSRHQ